MSERSTTALLGDSLTASGHWQEWLPQEDIDNHGVDGDTTDDLIARLPDVIRISPSTIVLMIGTNDLAWGRSVEHIVRNIETILVTVRQRLPAAQILLQSVLPREREAARDIREINRHLWQFAPTVRAQYLDLWPVFAREDGQLDPTFSDDRLHLNDEGYRAWLAELEPALETLRGIPPMSRPISLPKRQTGRVQPGPVGRRPEDLPV